MMYTHASKNQTTIGFGNYIPFLNVRIKRKISVHIQSMTAEMQTIFHALTLTVQFKPNNAIILTDTLSSLKLLQSPRSLILARKNLIYIKEYQSQYCLDIYCELVGNEIVDQLANDAIRLDIDPHFFRLHYSSFILVFKKRLILIGRQIMIVFCKIKVFSTFFYNL